MLSIRWFMVLILRFIMSKVELTFHHMAGSRFLIILQSEVFILRLMEGFQFLIIHPAMGCLTVAPLFPRINPLITPRVGSFLPLVHQPMARH